MELDKKLQVLASTGLTRDEIWKHLFLTKQRQNPFVERSRADFQDVERKWEAAKLHFQDYKKDCTRPPNIDLTMALHGFGIVLRGIVQGVFRQQAGRAWFPCRDLKLAITVLMPQSSEPHHWFGAVACREGSLSMSPHLWGTLNPDWRSGYRWLYLETPIVDSAQSIERKFRARDNSKLTDKFAKSHARDALWRGFRRAQEEMDRLRGRHLPTIDFNIAAALKRLLAHDLAREVCRAQILKAHVNMAVWRDRYGRLWRRKLT